MIERTITFAGAVNEALKQAMDLDPKVLCYGLGVTDPKHVFDTTQNLESMFGSERVFDIPCSENAITGIGVGAALRGYKSVITHQRLDFSLLSMDQIVNSAAKWHYMFGSQLSVPITIRMVLGRGWGQGPTHSQNLQAWFAHVPGLKVVCPSNANDAKGLLIASIFDPNPVIFLEHRWLHNSKSQVPNKSFSIEIGKANVVKSGSDITLVTCSYLVAEAISAADFLYNEIGISSEVIDLSSIKPLDTATIIKSVKKTKRLLCIDPGATSFSVSSERISRVIENIDINSIDSITKIGMPDIPEPTSYVLTRDFYNNADDIINKVLENFAYTKMRKPIIRTQEHHDVPGKWFKGPF